VRGVGTLFYVSVAAAAGSPLPRDERELIVWTAIACVVLSVIVHGITAGPLNRWLTANVLSR
jgi:NhaP-type Na+/H+ or K+/H+ antiporter